MAELLSHHKARKRFGQNFLHDDFWIEKIEQAIDAQPGQNLVEIGPGQAALTRLLVRDCGFIKCVEIDKDLVRWLQTQFDHNQIEIIEADALKLNWRELAGKEKLRLVGNLPYNISSPLLFKLYEISDQVADQHFMLQKEVVDRMCAAPGHKVFGKLSVMLQHKYSMRKLFDVPPSAFSPQPKVMSSVVRMVPLKNPLPVDEALFRKVVTVAFLAKRKTIKNNLSKWIPMTVLNEVGINPESRAEEIPVEKFIALTNKVSQLGVAIALPGDKI